MPDNNNEQYPKIVLYIVSVLIGFGAKLANMHKQKPVTFWAGFRQLSVTTMACWIVWFFCQKFHQDETSTYIYGCLSASFSNQVIMFAWAWVRDAAKIILKIDK